MPQTDCSVQVSITVQPNSNKLQVFVDVFMTTIEVVCRDAKASVGAGRRPSAERCAYALPAKMAENLTKGGSARRPHLARPDAAESPHRE
ncbi:unnamed protein product [Colias eurytheme]|nr:unnamed protein product [Colias eurytheme]